MDIIWVNVPERRYPIFIGEDLFSNIGEILEKSDGIGKVMVITNPTVGDLYKDRLIAGLGGNADVSSAVIPDGEEYKILERANTLYDSLFEFGMDRGSTIVALGGGVIGDLAGFVAATYKRGLPLIQVPTTLLAQVDASIGGKVGVDHSRGKNMIGTFYQPKCVIISLDVLTTLPERELKAGLVEVIKYGVIQDRSLFEYIRRNLKNLLRGEIDALQYVVKRSCQIKASIVAQDERESGLRMTLNFGHTIGHALEAATDYRLYRHGEAVAVGMICAAAVAVRLEVASEETFDEIRRLIEELDLPLRREGLSVETVVRYLYHDKKIRNGTLRFVLPKSIGEVIVSDSVSQEVIRDTMKEHFA